MIKKIIISIAVLLIVVILGGIGFGANYLYNLALNPDTSKELIFGPDDETVETLTSNETGYITDYEGEQWLLNDSNYEELIMTSQDGLKLHNYLIETEEYSSKWLIAVHGYTSEGLSMAKYGKVFNDEGYNVIIPDLRAHGSSEGDYIGMGWDERLDIIDLINYIVEKDSESQIVLVGVSMGGATVMNVSGEELPDNVKAIIEDCGYTSAWDQFGHQLDDLFGLPEFPMLHTASLIGKARAGYWISDSSPIESVAKSETPMLFIHGDEDAFVPYYMLDELYEAANTEKEKLVIEGAEHAKASEVAPAIYWDTVLTFVDKYIQ